VGRSGGTVYDRAEPDGALMSGPGPHRNLRTFLWQQRWEIGISALVLALIVAALLLLGGGAEGTPWSYSFF
jgi:hypothetical protein